MILTRGLTILCVFGAGSALAQQAHTLLGVNCAAPPGYHCPDTDCPGPMVTQPGDTVESKSRRTFFLDCPADYKPGDKVNIVLSLHGYGSYANWQRNYFPAMDAKDKYKLIVITPGSPERYWSDADDEYLHNIVDLVVATLGKENVQHFRRSGRARDPGESGILRRHPGLQKRRRLYAAAAAATAAVSSGAARRGL